MEKIWCVLGPEFGANAGKWAFIIRSLYGLKSSGTSFRNHLADCMWHQGWVSCIADHNLWMKAKVRLSDGHKYYAYALLYVDDILITHHGSLLSPRDRPIFQDETRLYRRSWLLLRCQGLTDEASKWSICLGHELQQIHPSCCQER
jgi:hypothetical protein